MTGKEWRDARFALRKLPWTPCGPEQSQNLETRGMFIHLCKSWRSVMLDVSVSVSMGLALRLAGLLLGWLFGRLFDFVGVGVLSEVAEGITCDGMARLPT